MLTVDWRECLSPVRRRSRTISSDHLSHSKSADKLELAPVVSLRATPPTQLAIMNPAYPDHSPPGHRREQSHLRRLPLCCPTAPSTNTPSLTPPKGFTELDAWLRKHRAPRTLAGLEATGPYGALLLWHLHQRSHRVSQLNPRRIKDYARSQGRRVKTDRTDAHLIACYLPQHRRVRALGAAQRSTESQLQALIRRLPSATRSPPSRTQPPASHPRPHRPSLRAAPDQNTCKTKLKTIDTELDLHTTRAQQPPAKRAPLAQHRRHRPPRRHDYPRRSAQCSVALSERETSPHSPDSPPASARAAPACGDVDA